MKDKQLAVVEAKAMQSYSVNKANSFIWNSMYCLTVTEQRILACAISLLDSRPPDISGNLTEASLVCEFRIDTFCELCGIDKRNSISYIKKLLLKLASKRFWIKNDKGILETVGWVEKCLLDPVSHLITIQLTNDMKPYLLNLDKNFTSYKLPLILRFQSKHTNAIFDLVYSKYCENSYVYDGRRKYSSGEFQMSIEDLKDRVAIKWDKDKDTLVKQNIAFKDFKIHMLEPAISDINKFTDILVEVEYLKRGLKVEAVCFKYKPKTKEELVKIRNDSFE